jgi:hypothetical protein
MLYVIQSKGGGVAAAFHSESEALATIRLAFQAHGRAYAGRYALVAEDGVGGSTPVASGDDLVDRALADTSR